MPTVGLILLAAGGSTRLGHPKQLVMFEGRTLLRRAAEAAAASVCRPLAAVLGAQAPQMRSELHGLPVQIAENPDWEQGMASSLHCGLDVLPDDLDGVAVILCDQPRLTGGVIDQLVTDWEASGAPLAACEYGGGLGVPALFGRALLPDLRALTGAEGAKSVLRRHAALAAWISFPGGSLDVDTADDLARLLSG